MIKEINLRLIRICIAAFCSVSFSATAENIAATLLTPKTVLQGEAVSVTVQIKNVSPESRFILVPVIRRFGPDTVTFSIQIPGSTQKQSIQRPDIYIGGLKNMPPSLLPIKKLYPGEVAEYSFSLVYDFPDAKRRKLLFDTPGRYSIQSTVYELIDPVTDNNEVPYNARRCPILTNSAEVEICPQKNQREKDALSAMWKLPDEYLIYAPFVFRSECHREAIVQFKEYFHTYSDTEIGRCVALPLGVAVSEGIIRDDSGAIRKALEYMSQNKQSPLASIASSVLKRMTQKQ